MTPEKIRQRNRRLLRTAIRRVAIVVAGVFAFLVTIALLSLAIDWLIKMSVAVFIVLVVLFFIFCAVVATYQTMKQEEDDKDRSTRPLRR